AFRFSEPQQQPRRRLRPSPSRLRFGEAVFTDGAKNPQEEKTPMSQNFCRNWKTAQNLEVGARKATRRRAAGQFSCGDIGA
ncbi:MAG: hypothetical protein ACK4P8_08355, partial [Tabrizicola sp.]